MDRSLLPQTLEEAGPYYAHVLGAAAETSQEHYRIARRWLCRNDLFFLLTVQLKRKDMVHPWIFDRCREVEGGPNGHLDLWARDHYKALDCDTPVWTTKGWKRHGDLKAGDRVYAPDGQPVAVIANTGPMNGADCFEVGPLVAAGDHLWPHQQKHKHRIPGGRRVSFTTEIVNTRDSESIRLPLTEPLQGDVSDLPIDPYVLGVWLGDGESRGCRVVASHTDAECMEHQLVSAGAIVKRSSHPNAVNLALGGGVSCIKGSSPFKQALRALDLLGNKHVPDIYWHSSTEQRLSLLQGLMDTDGSVDTRGTAIFVNTNERLVDAVAFLARSLGMRASKRDYRTFWQVAFQAHKGSRCPFRMPRKIERCLSVTRRMPIYRPKPTTTRPVNCIQVVGGLYLAGKQLIPTHNSTIITYGLTIQDILASHGDDPEERYGGREVTVGIFSHTRDIAKGFLTQIKQELEDNEDLINLFPDVLYERPKNQAPKWGIDTGLTVRRKTTPKECTVEAWGLVDGQPTSKHFFIRVYDDTVTHESVNTTDQMKKTTAAWEMSLNLGTEGGWERYVGTRYHEFDTYQEQMDREVVVPRVYACTSDGSEDFTKSVLKSPDYLADKRKAMGRRTFATQMLLDPKAGGATGFDMDWLRYWVVENWQSLNRYILVDPSSGKRKDKDNDYTAMWVVGFGEDGKCRVIDMVRDKLKLSERTKTLFHLHRKYKPIRVGYEEVGMQADLEHIQFIMERVNYDFEIVPLKATENKERVRIPRLEPWFERGDIFLPERLIRKNTAGDTEDLVQTFITEEYRAFPVCKHDDMLDALARITDEDMMIEAPVEGSTQKPRDPWSATNAASSGSWMAA